MSNGQRQRIPANFPRMKDRAAGRRLKRDRRAFTTLAVSAAEAAAGLAGMAASFVSFADAVAGRRQR